MTAYRDGVIDAILIAAKGCGDIGGGGGGR